MPKVASLGHLGFYVRDMERSVAFYRDILGMQVSDRSPRGAVFMTAQIVWRNITNSTWLPGAMMQATST
jgi:catechol 2,3-dioxygenase-like lactoylglutathione lyase family enzyme